MYPINNKSGARNESDDVRIVSYTLFLALIEYIVLSGINRNAYFYIAEKGAIFLSFSS